MKSKTVSLTEAAYKGAALDVDREFYRAIAQSVDSRTPVESFVIPIRSGRAWRVPAGHVCRISTVDGTAGGRSQRVESAQPA